MQNVHSKRYVNISSKTRRAGIPNLNFGFLVLCRNTCIPANAPAAPPITARLKSVASEIRHKCLAARRLSSPKAKKATKDEDDDEE